jgi:biotin transport system substrate-specific component
MTNYITLHSPRTAVVDRLRSAEASGTMQAASVVSFALLTAAAAQAQFYLWEVPITLQTAAVYGSGLFLGWRNGFLAQLLYLTLGLFLPVFAGEGFGPAYLLAAASAGYLMAAPLGAAVTGWLSENWNSLTGSMVAMAVGALVVFSLGVVWLHYAAGHPTWFESIDKGFLRFIPIDLAKIVGVSVLYSGIRRW